MKHSLLYLFLFFCTASSLAQVPGLTLDFVNWGSSPKETQQQLMQAGVPFTPYDAQHKKPCISFHYEDLKGRFLYEAETLQQLKLSKAFGLSEMEQAELALQDWENRIQAALPNTEVRAQRGEQRTILTWKTEEVEIQLSLLLGMNLELLYTRQDASLESTAKQ